MRTTLMTVATIWLVGNGGVPESKVYGMLIVLLIGFGWSLYWDIREGNKS